MHKQLLLKVIGNCRQRIEEGGCPTVPPFLVETLESAVVQLAARVMDLEPKPEAPSMYPSPPAAAELPEVVGYLIVADYGIKSHQDIYRTLPDWADLESNNPKVYPLVKLESAEQIVAAKEGEIARLNEWKDAVGGLVSSLRKLPTFDHEWGGDKNGWGFVFEWIKWVQNRAESAESRLAVVEAALETLLAKCPNCGGTGMVETGRIQFGYPSDSPCGLCANERKVFDAALKGVKK